GNDHAEKIPGWEFDQRSRSTNNRFYGYFAAEWHDNHHRLPTSANCAILPGQVDVVFLLIRALHAVGIVRFYHDTATPFRARLMASARAGERSGVGETDAPQPAEALSLAETAEVFLEK